MKFIKMFLLLFCLVVFANIAQTEDCSQYKIDLNRLKAMQQGDTVRRASNYCGGGCPAQADNYINSQRQLYQACIANQVGTPYEEAVCNGDYACIQRYDISRQYTNAMDNYSNALRNQHMSIDANINHSGNINYSNFNKYNW